MSDPEQTEVLAIPEEEAGPHSWKALVTGLFVSITGVGIALDTVVETHVHNKILNGTETPEERAFFEYFLSHIGDVTNGFVFAISGMIAGEAILSRLDEQKQNKLIQEARKWAPLLISLVVAMAVMDAETAQLLGKIFPSHMIGEAHLTDIPAGLFGILSANLLMEQLMKPKSAQTDKIDANVRSNYE